MLFRLRRATTTPTNTVVANAVRCAVGVRGQAPQQVLKVLSSCQKKALKNITRKLHLDINDLFQQGRQGHQLKDKEIWFTKLPLGHTVIGGDMLLCISQESQLSKRYASHCLPATAVNIVEKIKQF